jgi:hypothetical protein
MFCSCGSRPPHTELNQDRQKGVSKSSNQDRWASNPRTSSQSRTWGYLEASALTEWPRNEGCWSQETWRSWRCTAHRYKKVTHQRTPGFIVGETKCKARQGFARSRRKWQRWPGPGQIREGDLGIMSCRYRGGREGGREEEPRTGGREHMARPQERHPPPRPRPQVGACTAVTKLWPPSWEECNRQCY